MRLEFQELVVLEKIGFLAWCGGPLDASTQSCICIQIALVLQQTQAHRKKSDGLI
jgi:hypothetical protein